ncbi:hypothetical protein [Cytobacillus sp. FSL R5-0596]|uniref:hypothetical protein n=1 Tax=Cytobacillus sp. FSL R5-0596 TaxID=2954696 RepID=UPI0030FC153C
MKALFDKVKFGTLVLISLPLGLLIWLIYAKVLNFLDPILTIVVGGAFWLVIALMVVMFLVNIKDFIISIFKDDDTRNEKGFKKNL